MDPARYYGPFKVVATSVPVNATTVTPLCDVNNERVALLVGVSGANAIGVSTRSNLASGQGVNLSTGGVGYLDLNFHDHGPLVGQRWNGFATLATTVEVIEVIRQYDPDNPLYLQWNPNDRPVSK